MQEKAKIKVGISVGDLNGIGCEVILKTFMDARMLDFCTPVIFASSKTIAFQKKFVEADLKYQGINAAANAIDGKINVVNIWKESPQTKFGEATKAAGDFALKSLRAAVKALKEDAIDVLVTAPINKNNIQSKDFDFPGHTDYLAKELDGNSLMFMVSDDLRIGLLTDHIAVKDVAEAITPALIKEKVAAMMHFSKSRLLHWKT